VEWITASGAFSGGSIRPWRATGHNPVLMLGRLPQATLERAATDPRFLVLYRRACEHYDAYMQRTPAAASDKMIAYFSMEYGLVECMPIYSGGLGRALRRPPEGFERSGSAAGRGRSVYQKGYHQQY